MRNAPPSVYHNVDQVRYKNSQFPLLRSQWHLLGFTIRRGYTLRGSDCGKQFPRFAAYQSPAWTTSLAGIMAPLLCSLGHPLDAVKFPIQRSDQYVDLPRWRSMSIIRRYEVSRAVS